MRRKDRYDTAERKKGVGNHFTSIVRNKMARESFLVEATTALLSSPLRAG